METKCTICGQTSFSIFKKLFDDRFGYPGYFDMDRCSSCGHCDLQPKLKLEDITRLYTEFYPRQNINVEEMRRIQNSQKKMGIFDHLDQWFHGKHDAHRFIPKTLAKDSKVLDIGCGEGKSLFEIKSMGYDAYGVDPDKNLAPVRDNLGLNLFVGTIEEYPGKDNFDCIAASQLIEHIVNTEHFLNICKGLLKNNGTLILSTPNINSLTRKIFGRRWIHWHIPFHQQVFTKRSMRMMLRKNGFALMKIKMATPTQWLFHQLLSLRSKPIMGQRNPYWNKAQYKSVGKIEIEAVSAKRKIFLFIKKIAHYLISICFSIIDRILDILGIGDCMIVIAKKI